MDANGQRFWLWADEAAFGERSDCDWLPGPRLLTLAQRRAAPPLEAGRREQAESRLLELPWLRDSRGQLATWDAAERMLRAHDPEGRRRHLVADSAAPEPPVDLALDADDQLLMALPGALQIVDLRQRFEPLRLRWPPLEEGGTEAFVPLRIACDGGDLRLLLDRVHRRLLSLQGRPWRRRALLETEGEGFRPQPENPEEPRLQLLPLALPADRDFIAIACSRGGRVLLGAWQDERFLVHELQRQPLALGPAVELRGAAHAQRLAWLDEERIALRAGSLDEALVYALDGGAAPGDALDPLGERYPLREALDGGFVAGPPAQALHYRCGGAPGSRALVPLSWRAQRAQGQALLRRADAGEFGFEWHRAFVEAELPEGCSLLLELAASDDEARPVQADWFPHWIGDAELPAGLPADTPRAAWRAASELPLHPGLLPSEASRSGCFELLVQRAGRRLRALRGRWLWARLTLLGNGRRSPCVAALRLHGARFSYVRRYLPAIYRDEAELDPAAGGAATAPDFLERFTQLFEGELTRWEDLAAQAHLLTLPQATPAPALSWLAGLVGQELPAGLPGEPARRAWLADWPERVRQRGTLAGLQRALDVGLQGAVSRGAVIVVEDFRLRRTLATLLGVELSEAEDPLLPGGLQTHANSRVGDSLLLGDAALSSDFLAAFLPEALEAEQGSGEALLTRDDFYARTAHRATVLLHEELDEDARRLVDSLLRLETPAHVAMRVLTVGEPFLVGIAALLGVDSFLRAPRPPAWAQIARSRLGRGDRIAGGSLLDADARSARPEAVIDGPEAVDPGASFVLRAERSRAADGRELIRFTWTWRGALSPT